jgi:hypothetical protein
MSEQVSFLLVPLSQYDPNTYLIVREDLVIKLLFVSLKKLERFFFSQYLILTLSPLWMLFQYVWVFT